MIPEMRYEVIFIIEEALNLSSTDSLAFCEIIRELNTKPNEITAQLHKSVAI